ncbi:MAG: sel1 repeat family protein [Candidatus Riflebacteria bacterium]|nr:sel1 repeat family protein [Candidatus Riflebacteria bacterium]
MKFRALFVAFLLVCSMALSQELKIDVCRKAAERGDVNEQRYLGMCYYEGNYVPQDYFEAVKWFRKAAEQGYIPAQLNLGECYAKGHGVQKDLLESVKWYQKAAEQGDDAAQGHLVMMYSKQEGVPRDYVLAYMWDLIWCEKTGHTDARYIANLLKKMTPEQIERGQELARNWKPKKWAELKDK